MTTQTAESVPEQWPANRTYTGIYNRVTANFIRRQLRQSSDATPRKKKVVRFGGACIWMVRYGMVCHGMAYIWWLLRRVFDFIHFLAQHIIAGCRRCCSPGRNVGTFLWNAAPKGKKWKGAAVAALWWFPACAASTSGSTGTTGTTTTTTATATATSTSTSSALMMMFAGVWPWRAYQFRGVACVTLKRTRL